MHKETGSWNKSFGYNDPSAKHLPSLGWKTAAAWHFSRMALTVTRQVANGVQRTWEQGVNAKKNTSTGHYFVLYGVIKALFWKVQSPWQTFHSSSLSPLRYTGGKCNYCHFYEQEKNEAWKVKQQIQSYIKSQTQKTTPTPCPMLPSMPYDLFHCVGLISCFSSKKLP